MITDSSLGKVTLINCSYEFHVLKNHTTTIIDPAILRPLVNEVIPSLDVAVTFCLFGHDVCVVEAS